MRKDLVLAAGYLEAGLPQAAAEVARQALADAPDDADAHYILGGALELLEDPAASEHLGRAAELRPGDPMLRHAWGLLLFKKGRVEEALAPLSAAAALADDPVFAETLGACLMALSQPDRAEPHLARVVRARPDDPTARMNRAAALIDLNRCEEAVAACDRALDLAPAHAEARMTRAIALLLAGRWAEAWPEYEARWRTQAFSGVYPEPACPRWTGEALPPGSRLWVRGEQGYGDQIQFARFIPLAARRAGAPVAVSANASLHRLLAVLPGVEACVDLAAVPEDCAAEIPMQSLAGLFGATPEEVPGAVPYLFPPSDAPALPPRRGGRMRLGVAWAGKPRPRNRSIDPSRLHEALAELPAEVFSFQLGTAAQAMPAGWVDLSGELTDFTATAAYLAQMDAVLTVDTALAHLAGAMGRPTFILLIRGADWRWLRERRDTPWYPSARLFRQRVPGEWADPLAAAVAELQDM
jgi:Tfp pilus assembly protein PilF